MYCITEFTTNSRKLHKNIIAENFMHLFLTWYVCIYLFVNIMCLWCYYTSSLKKERTLYKLIVSSRPRNTARQSCLAVFLGREEIMYVQTDDIFTAKYFVWWQRNVADNAYLIAVFSFNLHYFNAFLFSSKYSQCCSIIQQKKNLRRSGSS